MNGCKSYNAIDSDVVVEIVDMEITATVDGNGDDNYRVLEEELWSLPSRMVFLSFILLQAGGIGFQTASYANPS